MELMITDYNLYPLHVFRMVARHGSVTRAAAALFISQPAVSAHLRALEAHLGALLFERTPRKMVLTTVGEGILDQVDRIFVLFDELPATVDLVRNRIAGEVVIAASSTPGTYLVPKLLHRFQRRYPDAIPILRIGASREVLDWLTGYEAPFGIVGEIRLPESIEAFPLSADQLRLTGPAADPICRAGKLDPAELKSRTLFVREPGSSTRAVVEGLFGGELKHFARLVEIPSTEAIKQAVAAGLGLAFLSSWACRLEEKAAVLGSARGSRWRKSRQFYLVKRKDRQLIGAAAALWNSLAKI
jgi:DNA-binding transcriptional LysR family regulator